MPCLHYSRGGCAAGIFMQCLPMSDGVKKERAVSSPARASRINEMKIKANILVVLFFFLFPVVVVYMLVKHPRSLFADNGEWRDYLGLLVCWALLWWMAITVYRLVTGSL